MNLSLISVLVVILAATVCQAKPKPGLFLAPYGFHRVPHYEHPESSYEISNFNAGLKESVDQIKGQMVLMTLRGLLQQVAMKGIAEKIDSMDERLAVVEGKLGITTTEKDPQVDNNQGNDEVEQVTRVAPEMTTDSATSHEVKDMTLDFNSKAKNPFGSSEGGFNDIFNTNDKQYEYSYKE